MKTKHPILIIAVSVFLAIALPVFAVDIRVKKEVETSLTSAALFAPNELVNLKRVFTLHEIAVAKTGLALEGKRDTIFDAILDQSYIPDPDEDDNLYLVDILNEQVRGKIFSSDELKFLVGLTGETVELTDRIKFLAERKLKE